MHEHAYMRKNKKNKKTVTLTIFLRRMLTLSTLFYFNFRLKKSQSMHHAYQYSTLGNHLQIIKPRAYIQNLEPIYNGIRIELK